MYAAKGRPSAQPGNTRCRHDPYPATGKSGTRNANKTTRNPAMTKFGSAMPIVADARTNTSSERPRLYAETTPALTPITSANTSANDPSASEIGSDCARMSFTVASR